MEFTTAKESLHVNNYMIDKSSGPFQKKKKNCQSPFVSRQTCLKKWGCSSLSTNLIDHEIYPTLAVATCVSNLSQLLVSSSSALPILPPPNPFAPPAGTLALADFLAGCFLGFASSIFFCSSCSARFSKNSVTPR